MQEKNLTLTTGQIANCWNDFEKITTKELKLNSKEFFNIPVSIVVKRRSNNQPVDQLSIENIAMNKEGTDIWLECFVNDDQMVEKDPKVKKHLDESEKKFEKLSQQLDKKRSKNK
jgi:hypothetical protein